MSLILSGTDGLSDVDGTAATPAIRGTDANTGIFFPAADTIAFAEGGVEAARFDSSGNFGLGVTPSAWQVNNRAIQLLEGYASISSNNSQGCCDVAFNCFNAGSAATSGWKYTNTGVAVSLFQQQAGAFKFLTAASGTAGNAITFTQAMTLNASSQLSIGTTNADGRLCLQETAAGAGATFYSTAGNSGGQIGTTNESGANNGVEINAYRGSGKIIFKTNNAEVGRFDSSGNLLVGATATAAYFDGKVNSYSASSVPSFAGKQGAATAAVNVAWNAATSGDNIFEYFVTEASPTVRGGINYNRAAGLVVYATTSDYRAKEISGPVVNSGVLIDSVPVYMGTMKGATQERPMFIAHETPEYAHTGEKDAVDAEGNPVYQQMDASALIPVMWAEIQSLRKRLADAGI